MYVLQHLNSPNSGAHLYINGYPVGSQVNPVVGKSSPGSTVSTPQGSLCIGQCCSSKSSLSTTTTTTRAPTTTANNPSTSIINIVMTNPAVAGTSIDELLKNNALGVVGGKYYS